MPASTIAEPTAPDEGTQALIRAALEDPGFLDLLKRNLDPRTLRGGITTGLFAVNPLAGGIAALPWGRMVSMLRAAIGGGGGMPEQGGEEYGEMLQNLLFDQSNAQMIYGPQSAFAGPEAGKSTGWAGQPGFASPNDRIWAGAGWTPGFEMDRPSLRDLLFEYGPNIKHSPRSAIKE